MSRSSSTDPGGGQTLFKDARYAGKYVAMRSFTDRNIVAVGEEPSEVLKEARQNGVDHPIVVFVPEHDMTFIY